MADLPVKLACWDYDRTRPLIDGRVKPEGIDLAITLMPPQQAFAKLLEASDYGAAEMSFSNYIALKAKPDCPMIAIPVMLSKMFRHDCIYVREGAGIARPEDLKGKRVGTIRYASTGIVYIKGFLAHDYGVLPRDIHWFIGGLEQPVKSVRPPGTPDDVKITLVLETKTLDALLEAGEIDAMMVLQLPPSFIRGAPHIRRLFPDFKQIEIDYYRRTGIFPVMHTVAIRKQLYDASPWVAKSLYQAFARAKDIALHGLWDTDALHLTLPFLIEHVEEARRVFGADFFSYGLGPNRVGIDALCQYLHEEALTPRRMTPEELFAPGVE
jgi:4,5-dihydroxyphthalate decarboxylase